MTSTNCPPAPKLPERTRMVQEDFGAGGQLKVLLDDSLVSDRAHSHCQLAEADLSRSSFMTTAEPRSQSARLAGSCLSYQAVVRVVHPAAPGCTLPPSICSPLLGSGPPLYQLTTYWTAATLFLSLRVDTVYELCSQTEVNNYHSDDVSLTSVISYDVKAALHPDSFLPP